VSAIVLIAGSPSSPSRSTAVLRAARDLCAEDSTMIELRELPAEDLLFGRASHALARAHALISGARAIVLATPVYKASYSGLLKTFLDYLPDGALHGKAAYPIATGGSSTHALAIDYAFKPVLSVLGASRILEGLYLTNDQIELAADGTATLAAENHERLRAGMKALLS
jgi:FMN reductase